MATGVTEKPIPPPPWELEDQKATGGAIPAPPFETDGNFPPAGELRQRARKHLADELPKVGAETQERMTREATAQAAEKVSLMLPFAIAAPFTGGQSLPVGLAIMGGAGLAGGIGKEAIEATQLGKTKSVGALLASLGSETAKGAAWELGLRGLGAMGGEFKQLLKETGITEAISGAIARITTPMVRGVGEGRTLLPKLIMKVAAETKDGAEALDTAIGETNKALYAKVGDRDIDIGKHLEEAYRSFKSLPQGKGTVGRLLTKPSGTAAEQAGAIGQSMRAEKTAENIRWAQTFQRNLMKAKGETERGRQIVAELEDKLKLAEDQIASHQPLKALVVEKAKIDEVVLENISKDEKAIFKKLSERLDGTIKAELKDDPHAAALYQQASRLTEVRVDRKYSLSLAEYAVRRMAYGTVIGGAVGARRGGVAGAVKGAGEGAAVGIGAALLPQFSVFALRRMLATPEAVPIWATALKQARAGLDRQAQASAMRAMAIADIPQIVKEFKKSTAAQPPPEPPVVPQP